jgi:signal transduction histidine kinase
MASRQKARAAFASAVVLLLISGIAGAISIARLFEGERWVIHTHEVQAALGGFDSSLARTARARQAFVTTRYQGFLDEFDASTPEVLTDLQRVKTLTADNAKQQELCGHLEDEMERRIALFRKSIDLARTEPQNEQGQNQILRQDIKLASDITASVAQMQGEEELLLQMRGQISKKRFSLTIVILALTLLFSFLMFSVHYKLLSEELTAREKAEQTARESEAVALRSWGASRLLSAHLLHIQDEERRKFSRELHDSLGQYLAGLKMHLGMLSAEQLADSNLRSCIELLDQSIAEVRTMSHLLHPPLLDEAGFAAAASWYVEGFSKRSGIEVSLSLPQPMARLENSVELVLFRIVQESLTNIHRHSKSEKADIVLEALNEITLRIRDYGTGFPTQLLDRFRSTGTSAGVGLSGMRERVSEVGGKFDIQSDAHGTLVSVRIPLPQKSRTATRTSEETTEEDGTQHLSRRV